MNRHFYFVANKHEGCGHRHAKKRAAQRCQRTLNRRGWVGRLYVQFPNEKTARPASATTNHSTGWTTDRTWQRRAT